MAPNRIVIDTDPGVDDILALLLAFSSKAEELEVLLLSITFGNTKVQNCLRNIVTLFHFIDKEQKWRKQNGRPEGFETMKAFKPIVAVGAEGPLLDQIMMADHFHGIDGLGGVHHSHPHLSPEETWETLFDLALHSSNEDERSAAQEVKGHHALFTPSRRPAHEEMLRLLRENEPDTITIVAIGPLTNLAQAAAADPETFLRAKEVVIMGGAIEEVGNICPKSEFNIFADSIAAARVFALTSPTPASTMPPNPLAGLGQTETPPSSFLGPYPKEPSKQLKLTMFPLDITHKHELTRAQFTSHVDRLVEAGSPLATWTSAFLHSTFTKIESLQTDVTPDSVGLALHDPLTIWYVLCPDSPHWKLAPRSPEDIRIETSGQWTRGMCIVDRRNRRMRPDDGEGNEVPGDTGSWLWPRGGNRIRRFVESPGEGAVFGEVMMKRLFSQVWGVES